MINTGQGQIASSKTLNSSGYINDPSRIAHLLLQSSFETCTILGSNSEPYLGSFTDVNGQNVATYADLTPKDKTGKSTIWIEDGSGSSICTPPVPAGLVTPHSGTKCLGSRSSNARSSGMRSCLQLQYLNGANLGMGGYSGLKITGDMYLSIWLYYPAGWSIPTVDPDGYTPSWTEVMNIYELTDTDYVNPKLSVHIERRTNGVYYLELHYERANNGDMIMWNMIDPFDITRITGKWTHWAWFMKRSTDSNIAYLQFWLDDVLLGTFNDANGTSIYGGSPNPGSRSYHFYTMNKNGAPNANSWLTIPVKTYLDGDGINYHYLWADDLEVWDGIP
jgi:hypothetical protein